MNFEFFLAFSNRENLVLLFSLNFFILLQFFQSQYSYSHYFFEIIIFLNVFHFSVFIIFHLSFFSIFPPLLFNQFCIIFPFLSGVFANAPSILLVLHINNRVVHPKLAPSWLFHRCDFSCTTLYTVIVTREKKGILRLNRENFQT